MKNTRTFTDIDLNFLPAPSSQDRHAGAGSITLAVGSTSVLGLDTLFMSALAINDNIYINGLMVGKIKSISSNTVLELHSASGSVFEGVAFSTSTPADIAIRADANAIKASLRNLILTMNHERPFNSKIGSQVKALMFELATPMTQILLQRTITDVILAYEPRVQLLNVIVDMNSESYSANITIYFQIINTTQPLSINLVLERAR
jgi:phage baseplate assembly protein W